ncbi:MAG: GNAT family acetyltransferase [Deltaproteobacteria bacterium]|jgi:ribosomal protein S18 acetylase RimI-like enzyme|nr:GNAT family acetyltransferase [Deltaproteobacteria bacterium]MDP6488616.1 GNAT family acetyltransferase [SAR324 cluster bacterium]MAF54683.1 GNAT family acetyltransferase [Deltaproteobacteria bacterium]MDP7171668.1 GNAT family acetyltransferase [SAR324 cluster bacterium]MDP7174962.1 GNAT family acetyltransferase [SAR324 cluster bacterium]|tara:strand:- start:583 stop:1026 length:444 start_codon:yes stop_codon:yes gene_type:complete
MSENPLFIRPFQTEDEASVVSLWQLCELTVPWNNPYKDIARKLKVQPELFLVGMLDSLLIATVMGGYDGHRGWINYLAVHPDFQGQGYAQQVMENVESELRKRGCPKINLQIRSGNARVMAFYQKLGFTDDQALSMGKRLEEDHSLN